MCLQLTILRHNIPQGYFVTPVIIFRPSSDSPSVTEKYQCAFAPETKTFRNFTGNDVLRMVKVYNKRAVIEEEYFRFVENIYSIFVTYFFLFVLSLKAATGIQSAF